MDVTSHFFSVLITGFLSSEFLLLGNLTKTPTLHNSLFCKGFVVKFNVSVTNGRRMMSLRSEKTGSRKMDEKRTKLIGDLWGEELTELKIWHRKSHDGYTTIPRTLPYIHKIMNELADVGKPVSETYFSLWCNSFDGGFVEIKDKGRFAYEAGFTGQRSVTTWLGRMKKLEELGFISSKGGFGDDFRYVLLINPHWQVNEIYKKRGNTDDRFNSLAARMQDIKAVFE